jgi:hypothetical protein
MFRIVLIPKLPVIYSNNKEIAGYMFYVENKL